MRDLMLTVLLLLAGIVPPAHAQEVTYIHTDASGSVVAMTDKDQNIIERREYEPYGLQQTPTTIEDGPGYTGHVQDAATGLGYMQQRYYDPQIGRLLSTDPITAYESGDPRQLNRYAYAHNNPYRFTDPDGRQAVDAADPLKFYQRNSDAGTFGMLLCGCDPYYRAPSGSGQLQPTTFPGEIFIPAGGLRVAAERSVASTFKIIEREGNVLVGAFKGAKGEAKVITEVIRDGDTLILRGTHIEGQATLKEALQVAREIGKSQEVSRVVIEGGRRTTGANPGRIPRPIIVEIEKRTNK